MATTTATPVEQVPGLPTLNVEGAKFFLKKNTEGYSLVLRAPGEEDTVTNLENVQDSTVTSKAHELIYERKIKVREKLIADSTEVELSA